jgi:hypothetical protein
MNSTRQSTDTDATADKQITSVVNCTTRVSVAGVSGINGGTNTTTAGTRTAIGTITTTTKQLWSAPFHGFAGLLAIDRHNTSLIQVREFVLTQHAGTFDGPHSRAKDSGGIIQQPAPERPD